jgi:hypothetical protein
MIDAGQVILSESVSTTDASRDEGRTVQPLQGRKGFRCIITVGFPHGYSCSSPSGSRERSNLFESPWWNRSLTILPRQGYTSSGTT